MPNLINSFNMITDSAMLKSAKKLYNALRKHAPYKKIKDSIFISRVQGNKNSRFLTVGINMNEETGGAPFARAFDIGSGLHGKRRRKYEIVPVNASLLQFAGTNMYKGKIIRTPLVMHPGVRGVGYTQKAIKEVRPIIKKELGESAKENLRLYLKAKFETLGK